MRPNPTQDDRAGSTSVPQGSLGRRHHLQRPVIESDRLPDPHHLSLATPSWDQQLARSVPAFLTRYRPLTQESADGPHLRTWPLPFPRTRSLPQDLPVEPWCKRRPTGTAPGCPSPAVACSPRIDNSGCLTTPAGVTLRPPRKRGLLLLCRRSGTFAKLPLSVDTDSLAAPSIGCAAAAFGHP